MIYDSTRQLDVPFQLLTNAYKTLIDEYWLQKAAKVLPLIPDVVVY